MVTVESNANRTNGITTVRTVITNTRSTPQRVRLRSRLEGPVWPPRRSGVLDPRWEVSETGAETEAVWQATIRPGRSRGVGFSSPAPPTDPPVAVVSSDRHEGDESARSSDEVLADLDGWRPASEVLEYDP
ncbi:hypothetical protein ACFQGT_07205 [Natrialbaceae archaeon GCM10025810]|uniref:DUF7857 domain-containing protein n=1 Tax=Halovalidus salilacus TaxID=3075124 RepID=UPI00361B5B15